MASLTYRTSYRADMRLVQTWFMRVWLALLLVVAIAFPIQLNDGEIQVADGYQVYLMCNALVAVTGAVALNLLTGYTGQVSLGNAAFLALGAIVGGIFGLQMHLPFVVVVPVAAVVGAVVGALVGLPSLRVRGLYLLLATMALHFIMVYVFLRYQLAVSGPEGLKFPKPSIGPLLLKSDRQWYYLFLLTAVGCCLFVKNLSRHAEGRALVAVRDHDVAAMVLGVNVARSKVLAFAISSAMITGLGAMVAYWQVNVTNDSFPLSLAIDYAAMIIIGGLGSVTGAVLGAFFITLFPAFIQQGVQAAGSTVPVLGQFTGARAGIINLMIFGLLIVLFLVAKPEGLAGLWQDVKRFFTQWPYSY